ncbi:MAG: response regulator [Promethearchaeota archaeon]
MEGVAIIRVFIIEDDNSLQRLYTMVLTNFGFKIIGNAYNGAEALEMYKNFSEKPEIIILDHRMPVKDGLQTFKEILQLGDPPFIIFASADKSIKEEVLNLGAVCFLEKPFSIDFLINELKKIKNITIAE